MKTDNERAIEALNRLTRPEALSIALSYSAAISGTHRHWSGYGALAIAAPAVIDSISSPTGAGSDSIPVGVTINSQAVYLTDSAQFTLELATRVLKRPSYYVMPSFRGEQSDATHLAEFVHAEIELPGSITDAVSTAEQYVRTLITAIGDTLSDVGAALLPVFEDNADSISGQWPRISYTDAIEWLGADHSMVHKVGNWPMPTYAGEQKLIELAGDIPIWLTEYPVACVPFYQAYSENLSFARCADLIVPRIGEILGAGERHSRSDDLRLSMSSHAISDPARYDWYVNLRDSYPMCTSGFGLGIERLLAWLLNLPDISAVPVFPRQNP
jgi:asparaginyl-tRNA synthetase